MHGTLNEAMAVFIDLGPGALLEKFFDIIEACCNIPVHTDDSPLLSMTSRARL